MKQLSIIIPMYNVEPYVERCIRSIETQDIPKESYEVICINDGSPDNCKNIVNQLQEEFDNIILIDQENQGVSRARNNGIDKASGKYLLFIDPDDYVDNNCFNRILTNADSHDAQVSFLGFTFLEVDGYTIRRRVFNEDIKLRVFRGIEIYYKSRGDGRIDPDRMWAVLYKRELFNSNNLRYLPNVPFLEDGELIARVLCLSERCIFDGYSFYNRTTRVGSATNSNLFYRDKSLKGFVLAANNLKRFQLEAKLTKPQKTFLNQPICKFVFLITNSALVKPFYRNYKSINKLLKDNGVDRIEKDGVVPPYSRYVSIYNNSFIIYLFISYLKRTRFFYRLFRLIGM